MSEVLDWIRAARARAQRELEFARAEHERVVAECQQQLINAELCATRRVLIREARHRARTGGLALCDPDFLTVADRPALLHAILDAASTTADACDLQIYDPVGRVLHLEAQRGFGAEFLAFFAAVDAQQPTACAHALRTGKPVAVPNLRRSSIFFGQPTLAPLLEAGSRAVLSYPLLGDNQEIVGVLSFHYAKTNPTTGNSASIAQATAWALRHTPPSQETSTATALTS